MACFIYTLLILRQTRLVKCIGSEADNIRPAQRALQFFKSDKILQLVTGSTSADITDDEANAVLRAQVADRCLSALLPALYREGRPSWNPTVNKMTALALRNIRVSCYIVCYGWPLTN